MGPREVDLEQLFHMIDADSSGTVEVRGFGVQGFRDLGLKGLGFRV